VDGEATYYLSVNRNRRSVVIDLRSDDDRLFLRSLVGAADAVVENYLPSQARELGIEQMKADFPDVVWVTVAPAALGGPLGDEPSFDLLAQARSGIMGVTGSPESGPLKVGSPIADVVTGLYACIGLLTGLFARASDRSTPGLRIEAPLLESTIASLINQAGGYLGTQKAPRLLGNEHPNIVPYAPYATADRELLIAVATEAQFKSLCRALGTEAVGAEVQRVAIGSINVRTVVNELVVAAPSSLGQRSNDTLIGSKVRAALLQATDVPSNAIKPVTERGQVYLLGLVTAPEGDRAARAVARVLGVQRVVKAFDYLTEEQLQQLKATIPVAEPPPGGPRAVR
jgi:crotonobetainyl-CoA:carnitine CoA-transferase CaiB-like acyl-CoA transferase